MTTATHPLAGQSAGASMLGQQGTFGPGFPPPIGAEQFFGQAPQAQYPGAMPGVGSYPLPAYGGMPWQSGSTQFALSPVQQVAAQVAPIVQQAILPYAISAACQQVQQHLPQIVGELVARQGQQWQVQGPQWQQYPNPSQGQSIFGQGGRPNSYLP